MSSEEERGESEDEVEAAFQAQRAGRGGGGREAVAHRGEAGAAAVRRLQQAQAQAHTAAQAREAKGMSTARGSVKAAIALEDWGGSSEEDEIEVVG